MILMKTSITHYRRLRIVSNFNNMGAGLAKRIKVVWPQAYSVDLKTIKGDRNKLGSYSQATIHDRLHIVNIYSQYSYGSGLQLSYTALGQSINSLLINTRRDDVIYLVPKFIGCGHAGGDHEIVMPMIENLFSDVDCYLFDI